MPNTAQQVCYYVYLCSTQHLKNLRLSGLAYSVNNVTEHVVTRSSNASILTPWPQICCDTSWPLLQNLSVKIHCVTFLKLHQGLSRLLILFF